MAKAGAIAAEVSTWFVDNPLGRLAQPALEDEIRKRSGQGAAALAGSEVVDLLKKVGVDPNNTTVRWLGRNFIKGAFGLAHINFPRELVGGSEKEAMVVEMFLNDLLDEAGKGVADAIDGEVKAEHAMHVNDIPVATIGDDPLNGIFHKLDGPTGVVLCREAVRTVSTR